MLQCLLLLDVQGEGRGDGEVPKATPDVLWEQHNRFLIITT